MTHLRPRWIPLVVFLTGALAALGGLPLPVQAQPVGRLVVVPHATHDLTEVEQRAADLVESGVVARRVRLISMHDARDRVEAQSRPPASPDNSDLDVLAHEAHAALEHVAFGRSGAAQRSVQEVLSRAERALESLNRETKTARHVLDACLALVRNALARGARRDALAEAMRCRRLVPDVSPSEMLHPASVIGVLAEADDQLRRMRIGRLVIQSKPESGCAAYVNGRHLGVTPFRLERAAAGEYRVQVECGRTPGRVHFVQLGDDVVELMVDAEYDRALRSGSRVSLVYGSEKDRARLVEAHAAQLARSIKADEALLVQVQGGNAMLVRVSASDGRLLGRVQLPWLQVDSIDAPAFSAALDALFQGRIEAAPLTASEPSVAAATSEQPPAAAAAEQAQPLAQAPSAAPAPASSVREKTASSSHKRTLRILAGSLALVGAGLFATGVAYEIKRERSDARLNELYAEMDPSDAQRLEESNYDRAAKLRWMGIGGAALMTATAPLLRVDVSEGVPWWSYVLGAGGVGLAVWGGYELSKDGDCLLYDDDGCYQQRETVGRGALLIAAAAPLLSFPISHVIEWSLGKRESNVRAQLAPTPTSLQLVVRKELGRW